ncbi:hypothetical protein EG339_03505 [Chryseobacterium bernardetii]|uniref:Uncharacterized protein n=1 Tax=Chryseobacterium bernardetii TaxID=1241978 RepID=A0A3G6T2U7_9FLAO|nr:hypothetical protein EG339_03505 [Chryseobacterium bernardetii]
MLMKKNLVFRVAILGTIAFSLLSCRTEDEVASSPMQTVNRFQVFTSRNGEPVNYSRGTKSFLKNTTVYMLPPIQKEHF